ncbi:MULTISPECIES: helix-turn-helix domain-containing protein [unclassified Rhizobium]|jgi:chromosomal replication initiation ATPase DnaA|uniref:helix-turn-helix domain-containing protein n=1 Tax=unclassified Rhizobium TaxID=2613769 RepID=UPI003D2CC8AF
MHDVVTPPSAMQCVEICRIVRYMVAEMIHLSGDRVRLRQDRRRMLCHVRQIAMYVCHVVLSIPLSEIGPAFGRDRTTVGHACHVVEDRRDDRVYDDFISSVERIVSAVFARMEVPRHD